MTLKLDGQEIDICGAGARIFNQRTGQWERLSDTSKPGEDKEIFGKMVKVEPIDSLMAYKLKLGREVDLEDVRQLKDITENNTLF